MKIVRPASVTDSGSFTRATTGTYYNSNGLLQTAAINVPRFTYNPLNLAAGPVLLTETASTNTLIRSEEFDNATWLKTDLTVTPNTISAPNGVVTADTLTSTASDGLLQQVYTSAVGNKTHTVSIWLRSPSTDVVTRMSLSDNGASGSNVVEITVTNVWKRFVLTHTSASSATGLTFQLGGASTLSTGKSIYVWGAQLEEATTSSSYIPTTTTAVTRAADINSAVLVSNVPENDYPVWSASSTYAIGDNVLHPTNHKIYQSTVAGNINHMPPNTQYWIDTGFDNRWRMFDQSVTSQTSQSTSVCVAITPGTRIDSIVGLNCSAATATINVVDPTFGLVYSSSVVLTSYSGITDWYAYYYEPIVQLTDFIVSGIPVGYSNSTITVCINATGTASIGGLVLGLSRDLGVTGWGAKVGIIDYSVKTRDSFGNYVITPRNFSKRADFNIQVDTNTVDALQNILASYRSIPVVYIGSNDLAPQQFSSTIIYGFYKDFSIDITYSSVSTCSIQVEGLT